MGEAKDLEKSGHPLKERLHISKKAHLIMPTHRILDRAYEAARVKIRLELLARVLVLLILIRSVEMVYVLVISSVTSNKSMLLIRIVI